MSKKSGRRIVWRKKKQIKIWDVDNTVISKSIEIKNISKYLTGYLDEVIRQLVLVLPKMGEYVKTFKEKNNELLN